MATDKKFIGERTIGRISRDNPDTPFLSKVVPERDTPPPAVEVPEGKVDVQRARGRLSVDTPNGCAYSDGDDPGAFFEQGARGGQMSTYQRRLYGGNRTGE